MTRSRPTLDVSGHLLDPQAFSAERGLRWDEVFGSAHPVELEIGSGKGLFLANAAKQRPDHNFLGIEISKKYARLAAERAVKHGLGNVRIWPGDARPVVERLIPEASLCAVHVYFPDPWWKKRHKKRRVMNEGFLRDVERTLVAGGRLHFWTDVEEYFQSTLELIAQTVGLQGPVPVPVKPAEHDLDYRTHFERRMRQHDLPVFRAEFVKP